MASEEAGMETRSEASARERIRAVMSSPVSAAMIADAVALGDALRDVVEGDEASFALLVQLPVPVPDDLPEAVAHRGEKITQLRNRCQAVRLASATRQTRRTAGLPGPGFSVRASQRPGRD